MAGLFSLLSGVGSAAAGYNLANDIRGVGQSAAEQMGSLAGQLQEDTAFRGYGVTTGLGNTSVDQYGNTTTNVGQDPTLAAYAQGLFQQGGNPYEQYAMQAAQNSMQPIAQREQDIYNRAMAMQAPALDRAQAAQQAREYQMGRGGIRGSQFGGTAEDAAMARARAEASNAASFQAMGQAQTEMMNQGSLASNYGQLGNMYTQQGLNAYQQSFNPLAYQLQAMQEAGRNADRYQSGQFTGANLAGQLGLGGIQSQVNAETAASQLWGNLFGAGMNAIGGLGQSGEGLLDTIKRWF